MFCPKCGNKVKDDAKFCHYCGTKLSFKAGGDPDIDGMFEDSTELVISIAKVEDRRVAKWKFPLFIDDIPIDELSNGQEAIYKIQPGEHCIQIGIESNSVRIWILTSGDNYPIRLNYVWGVVNSMRDIVCLPPQVVTKPSEIEKFSIKNMPPMSKIGLACFALGLVGLLLAYLLMPISSGSAESHAAALAAMPPAIGAFIGGFVLMFIGVFLLNLPAWRKKREIRRKLHKA